MLEKVLSLVSNIGIVNKVRVYLQSYFAAMQIGSSLVLMGFFIFMSAIKSISIKPGERFGLLVFLREESIIDKNTGHKIRTAFCKCDCGNTKEVILKNLFSGNSKSCGCTNSGAKVTHGMAGTRIYGIWAGMKDRCYNSKNHAYDRYGGRGIIVCTAWIDDFSAFYKWAMANGYDESLTLDRRKNNKGYSPSNCRWVDKETQANNRRSNTCFIHNGFLMSLASICKTEGLKSQYKNVWNDISRRNISLADSILKRKNDLSITESN